MRENIQYIILPIRKRIIIERLLLTNIKKTLPQRYPHEPLRDIRNDPELGRCTTPKNFKCNYPVAQIIPNYSKWSTFVVAQYLSLPHQGRYEPEYGWNRYNGDLDWGEELGEGGGRKMWIYWNGIRIPGGSTKDLITFLEEMSAFN